MPKTWFRPQIDELKVGKGGEADEKENDEIRERFQVAIDTVYNLLKPYYNGALDLYEIRKRINEWITKKIPPERTLHESLVFVSLDYFYSRCFKSRIEISKQTRANQLNCFIKQRQKDHMFSNSHLLLSYMTIANLIPEKWLSESLLIGPVKEEIKKMPEFKDVHIDIDLALQPGGKLWIYENFLENWEKLKNYIDAGRPWPIRLMAKTLNPYQHKSVIAYGYEDTDERSGKIYVYDIHCPAQEHTIDFKIEAKALTIAESCTGANYSRYLHGFFCEDYSITPPPHSKVSRFLNFILPMKSIWYAMRFIYLLCLWVKKLITV